MNRSRYVAQAGVIAAVYAALTFIVIQNPLGYGPIQLRLSEAVTVTAVFTPAAIPGLALGCAIANAAMLVQFGPFALLDVVFGSLATLLGAAWTYRLRAKPGLALLGPVVANALIVPAYLPIVLGAVGFYDVTPFGIDIASSWPLMYAYGVVTVGVGQAVVMYALGLPLLLLLRRVGLGRMFGDTEQ